MKKMNPVQKILDLIMKMMSYKDFESSFTAEERTFIEALKAAGLRNLRKEHSLERRSVLRWDTGIDEEVYVACHVSGDKGFEFLDARKYKRQSKAMKLQIKLSFSPDEVAIIEAQIETLKKIFLAYDKNVGKYFL